MTKRHRGFPRAVALLLLFVLSCDSARTRSSVQAAATIPFELANNLIMVPTRINGFVPAFFSLDTGASASVIDNSLAQRLGLKLEGDKDVSTSGGTIGGSVAKDAIVSLPHMDLGGLNLLAIPLAGVEAGLGRAVGGILGAELFDRFVVEIDYATQTIRLYDPALYQYLGAGQSLPTDS